MPELKINKNIHIQIPFNRGVCEVCAAPVRCQDILEHQQESPLVCESLECRRIISQKLSNPLMYKVGIELHQKNQVFRQVRIEERENINKQEMEENERIFHSVLKALPAESKHPLHFVSIPTALSKMTSINKKKLASYEENLQAIIEKVYSEEPKEDGMDPDQARVEFSESLSLEIDTNPVVSALRDKLCATCKGSCCARGTNHAFITNLTIKRVRKSLPDHSAEELLHEYMSRISDQTVEGSCVNQTVGGCTLPRHLRSEVCNTYFCPDLKDLADKVDAKSPPRPVLAIQRSYVLWDRLDKTKEREITGAILVEEDNTLNLDLQDLQLR